MGFFPHVSFLIKLRLLCLRSIIYPRWCFRQDPQIITSSRTPFSTCWHYSAYGSHQSHSGALSTPPPSRLPVAALVGKYILGHLGTHAASVCFNGTHSVCQWSREWACVPQGGTMLMCLVLTLVRAPPLGGYILAGVLWEIPTLGWLYSGWYLVREPHPLVAIFWRASCERTPPSGGYNLAGILCLPLVIAWVALKSCWNISRTLNYRSPWIFRSHLFWTRADEHGSCTDR